MRFDHVSFSYHTMKGETTALTDISFALQEGEFLSVVGPSGCGKSTILSLIAGLLEPEKGSVFFHGLTRQQADPSIGYMLQRDTLLEWRTIWDNVLLGPEIQGRKNRQMKEKAEELLKRYDLYPFRNSRPSQLSGGMRQRAALIRTLMVEPELLLLDEPFSALDYETRLAVGNDIAKILREEKQTAVLVTHDLSEAISLGDRILVLSRRPASIVHEEILDFPKEMQPLEKRNIPRFQQYFQSIWRQMGHEE